LVGVGLPLRRLRAEVSAASREAFADCPVWRRWSLVSGTVNVKVEPSHLTLDPDLAAVEFDERSVTL